MRRILLIFFVFATIAGVYWFMRGEQSSVEDNIFSPATVKVGDTVVGLRVVSKGPLQQNMPMEFMPPDLRGFNNYKIVFSGQVTLSGEYGCPIGELGSQQDDFRFSQVAVAAENPSLCNPILFLPDSESQQSLPIPKPDDLTSFKPIYLGDRRNLLKADRGNAVIIIDNFTISRYPSEGWAHTAQLVSVVEDIE